MRSSQTRRNTKDLYFFKALKGSISPSTVVVDEDKQRTRKCVEITLLTQFTFVAVGRSGSDRSSGRVMTVSACFGLSIHSGWRKIGLVDCAYTSPRLKQCSAARTSAWGRNGVSRQRRGEGTGAAYRGRWISPQEGLSGTWPLPGASQQSDT